MYKNKFSHCFNNYCCQGYPWLKVYIYTARAGESPYLLPLDELSPGNHTVVVKPITIDGCLVLPGRNSFACKIDFEIPSII